MALQLANVALSDTFNTWRVRTNQIIAEAGSTSGTTAQTFVANTTFSANVTISGTLSGDAAAFTGAITAPTVIANTLTGTLSTAAQPNITSLGSLNALTVAGDVTADAITANTFSGSGASLTALNASQLSTGTVPSARISGAYTNITGVGSLNSLTVAGDVTADRVTANTFAGDGSALTGVSAGLDWSATTTNASFYPIIASNTSGAGVDQFNIASSLSYNPSTGALSATSFSGDGSGLTGISAGATVTDKSDNVNYNIVFTNETSGTQSLAGIDNAAFTFNPSTGQVNATIFNATSDVTLKTNLNVIDDALSIIDKLNGYRFNWKNNNNASAGVSAQEVEKVLPEVVSTNSREEKSVNYNGLVSVLIQAIKELKEEVNTLKQAGK